METPTKYRIGFWINLFIAIDQLGNALAAGYADTTVSARVGYYSYQKYLKRRWRNKYWRSLRWVIDWAFYPLDGPEHCRQSFENDSELVVHGSDWALAVLGLLVLITAPIIGVLTRLVMVIKQLI